MERVPEEEEKIGFALGIRPIKNNEGTIIKWSIETLNQKVPLEIAISLMQNWLELMNESYFARFKSDLSSADQPKN